MAIVSTILVFSLHVVSMLNKSPVYFKILQCFALHVTFLYSTNQLDAWCDVFLVCFFRTRQYSIRDNNLEGRYKEWHKKVTS